MRQVPQGRRDHVLATALLLAALLGLSLPSYGQSPPWYRLTWLNGGTRSQAFALNDHGQVVGYALLPGGEHAVLWDPAAGDATVLLGTLGGSSSRALAINAAGQVAGVSSVAGNTASHAVLWQATAAGRATPIDLGTLGGQGSVAYGINASGQAAGYSHTPGNYAVNAVLWSLGADGGTIATDLGRLDGISCVAYGMNDRGQIAGYYSRRDFSVHALLWRPTAEGMMAPVELGVGSYGHSWAFAINEIGQVAGQAYPPGGSLSHAVRWDPVGGTMLMTDLGTLGGIYSGGFGINDSGLMVGTASTADETRHAVLWVDNQIVDLNTRVIGDTGGGTLREAWGINMFGQIAGWGFDSTGQIRSFLLTPGQPNRAPVANVGPDRTVEADAVGGANVTLDGSGSMDPDGDALSYAWDIDGDKDFNDASGVNPISYFALGRHEVELRVVDPGGLSSLDAATVEVVDTTPPQMTLTVLLENLWPANRELALVAEVSGISDICDPTPAVVINVSYSDPARPGAANTDPDWDIVQRADGVWEVWVRASLSGGPERHYDIAATASDAAGNAARQEAIVTVKNNRRPTPPRPLVPPGLAASPTPAGGAEIVLSLISPSVVSTAILNLAGREVAVLPERGLEAGLATISWDGRSSGNTKVPAGIYLVRVTLRTNRGEQTQMVTGLSLRR